MWYHVVRTWMVARLEAEGEFSGVSDLGEADALDSSRSSVELGLNLVKTWLFMFFNP